MDEQKTRDTLESENKVLRGLVDEAERIINELLDTANAVPNFQDRTEDLYEMTADQQLYDDMKVFAGYNNEE